MERISSGNEELNEWLGGGYEKDIITVFYGPAGSGKTNLCVLASVEQAKKGGKIVYIDTEGGFSVERMRQIGNEELGKNILILKATNFNEQREAFNKLLEIKNISLIIVDSILIILEILGGFAHPAVKLALGDT